MAHMKIALLKCKDIPPTVFPPSASLVILLKSTVLCASLAFVLSKLPEGCGWLMGPPLLTDPQAWHTGHVKAAPCSVWGLGKPWLCSCMKSAMSGAEGTAGPVGQGLGFQS